MQISVYVNQCLHESYRSQLTKIFVNEWLLPQNSKNGMVLRYFPWYGCYSTGGTFWTINSYCLLDDMPRHAFSEVFWGDHTISQLLLPEVGLYSHTPKARLDIQQHSPHCSSAASCQKVQCILGFHFSVYSVFLVTNVNSNVLTDTFYVLCLFDYRSSVVD